MSPFIRELVTQIPVATGACLIALHIRHDRWSFAYMMGGLLLVLVGGYVRGFTQLTRR
jgi:hypothetical protein